MKPKFIPVNAHSPFRSDVCARTVSVLKRPVF